MKLNLNFSYCPVCTGNTQLWRSKTVNGVIYDICACENCHFGFVNPRPNYEDLQLYYSSQIHKGLVPKTLEEVLQSEVDYPNATVDAKRIISFLKKMLKSTGNLLDVGCGCGIFSKEAIDHGFAVTAIEAADSERCIARQMIGIDPIAIPFEEFEPNISFNAILMSQVLEHSADPMLWLRKANKLLNIGGAIAIAVPNFSSLFDLFLKEKSPFVSPPEHLNFFNEHNLYIALEKSGFKVCCSYTVSRLPKNTIVKKLPLLLPLGIPLNIFQEMLTKSMDYVNMGMFVNIFASKAKEI